MPALRCQGPKPGCQNRAQDARAPGRFCVEIASLHPPLPRSSGCGRTARKVKPRAVALNRERYNNIAPKSSDLAKGSFKFQVSSSPSHRTCHFGSPRPRIPARRLIPRTEKVPGPFFSDSRFPNPAVTLYTTPMHYSMLRKSIIFRPPASL